MFNNMVFKRFLLLFTLLYLIGFNTYSQVVGGENDSTTVDTLVQEKKLPELNVFIESALNNSPLLRINEREIDKFLEEISMQKKSWTDFFLIDANTKYGLFNQLLIDEQSTTSGTDVATKTAKEQFNYYGGLTIRMPLSTFLNKKNELKILKSDIEESKLKNEQLKKEITQLVIEEYFKLVYLKESMEIAQDAMQTTKINYMRSIRDFENGILNLNDFTILVNTKAKSDEAYSKVKNEYYAQFYKIQILTGINLQDNSK